MKHFTFILSLLAAGLLNTSPAFASEEPAIGMVNLTNCMSDSKLGKQEQESLQNLQSQMISLMEDTDKEFKEIDAKLKDTEYLDSLSPQAEAELQAQREQLARSLNQYQGQFYQVIQQTQYQIYQKILTNIAKASEEIAKQKNLKYILNKEACFYINPDLDITQNVIIEMDRNYDTQKEEQEKSNQEASFSINSESTEKKAS